MDCAFATNNPHKLEEVRAIVPKSVRIRSLKEIEHFDEIPEEADSLQGNAFQKADTIYRKYGLACFADDTGLEVDALGGDPGVYSARYAGPGCSFEDNVKKLLKDLHNISNRRAQFRTVICLIIDGKPHYFEGTVKGWIADIPAGKGGFGYDPVFVPQGYSDSFAEMQPALKNKISHRAHAVNKLAIFLNNYLNK